MVFKLIQAAGFVGRSKFAEQELSGYAKNLEEEINQLFEAAENLEARGIPATARDQVQYFIEFNNKRLPVNSIACSTNLVILIDQLKKQLHY